MHQPLEHPRTEAHEGLPLSKDGIIRRGFGLKAEILGQLNEDYHSAIIETIREHGNRWETGELIFELATHFGFCYGVDKAIDFAYETHRRFPDRRIFLTTEIIHNPRVNRRMMEMGIRFLNGQYADGTTLENLRADDVVLLPAFGVDLKLLDQLRRIGCILVDTTCGSVVHVWKRVERYGKEGFTSVIHGKWRHEETVATKSHATMYPGGKALVVYDYDEAEMVCDFIRAGFPEGQVAALERQFIPHAVSEGFDFREDLKRIGVANQTTMLSSESLEIARRFRRAITDWHGAESVDEHFRSFDTICNATQERQDAVIEMVRDHTPDLMLVVGGFNSSNTAHLCEIADRYCPTYYVDEVSRLISPQEIEHRPANGNPELIRTKDWLPARRPLRIGLTAGASTPNRVVGEVVERIVLWEEGAAAG